MTLEPVTLVGGSWDGEHTDIHLGDPPAGSLQRRNRNGAGHDEYRRTDLTVEFTETVKLRAGRTKERTRTATVFQYSGTRASDLPLFDSGNPELGDEISREFGGPVSGYKKAVAILHDRGLTPDYEQERVMDLRDIPKELRATELYERLRVLPMHELERAAGRSGRRMDLITEVIQREVHDVEDR